MNYLQRLRDLEKDKKAKKEFISYDGIEAKEANEAKRVPTATVPGSVEPPCPALVKADLPIPPLKRGWLVAYRDELGRLRGGCDERDLGMVWSCQWDGSAWMILLLNGVTLPLRSVVSVAKVNGRGDVIAGWEVKACGYDGEGGILREDRS